MYITEFQSYLKSEKRFSDHTIIAYLNDLTQFFKFNVGNVDLSVITHKTIRNWLVSLLTEEKLSSASVNRKLSTLKTYYRFLILSGKHDVNPTLKVIAPKMGKKLPEFVDQTSMNKLLDIGVFTDDFTGARDRLVMELFYQTGIRLSELIGLKVSDVDFVQQVIKVTGKRNKQRVIPITTETQGLINDFLRFRKGSEAVSNALIITQKGKEAYPKLIYNVVNKYLGQVSTNNKRSPHVLRHTFATHMLNNGADLNTIKALLGHANLSATQVYTHNSFEKLKTVYNQAHPRA